MCRHSHDSPDEAAHETGPYDSLHNAEMHLSHYEYRQQRTALVSITDMYSGCKRRCCSVVRGQQLSASIACIYRGCDIIKGKCDILLVQGNMRLSAKRMPAENGGATEKYKRCIQALMESAPVYIIADSAALHSIWGGNVDVAEAPTKHPRDPRLTHGII